LGSDVVNWVARYPADIVMKLFDGKKMMTAQGMPASEGFKHESPFLRYEHDHYVVTAVK
jgi:hypothetical protein